MGGGGGQRLHMTMIGLVEDGGLGLLDPGIRMKSLRVKIMT